MYYIYELIDPRDGGVFYVGKGKGGRIDQHEIEARKGRQSRKCERIREIEAAGLQIGKRKVSTHKCELEAYEAEIERIALYGLARLTNILSGGGKCSTGPTTYEDRRTVAQVSQLLRRSRHIEYMEVAGRRFYPNKELVGIVDRVIRRRSFDWVNEVAAKYNVHYQPAPAQ